MPGRQVLEVEVVTDGTEPGWLVAIAPRATDPPATADRPSFAAPPEAAPPDWPLGGKYRLSACTGTAPRRWVITVRANGATQGYVEYELFARLQVAAPRLTEGEATVGASLLRDGVDGFALGWSYFFVRVPPAAEVQSSSTLQSGSPPPASPMAPLPSPHRRRGARARRRVRRAVGRGGRRRVRERVVASHVEVSDSFVRSYQSEGCPMRRPAAPPTPQPSADCATRRPAAAAARCTWRCAERAFDAGLRFRLQVDARARARARLADAAARAARQRQGTQAPHEVPATGATVRADVATNPEGLPEAAASAAARCRRTSRFFPMPSSPAPTRRRRRRSRSTATAAPTAPTAGFGAFSLTPSTATILTAATATLWWRRQRDVCVADARDFVGCRDGRR